MVKALNNTLYYTIGAIIKAMASFLLLPIFTNILGAEQYGVLNLLQTFSAILATVMTLAVERSLYRLFYDYQTEIEQKRFLSSVFWSINITSLIVLGVCLLGGNYLSKYMGGVDTIKVILPVIIYTFLMALINYVQIIMQIEQKGKTYLIISLMVMVFYNIFSLLFLFFYSKTVESLVYANLIANLFVLPYAYKNISKRIGFVLDYKCLENVFKYSSPLLFMAIFSWALNVSDRLFIAHFSSLENAGIYSLASKIVSIVEMLAGAVFLAYSPFFYEIANKNEIEVAKSKIYKVNWLITFFICSICLFIGLVSKIVVDNIFSNEYHSATIFIYILLLSSMFTQQSGLLNVMIYQNKKTIGISIITVSAGILSVVLNTYFISIFGAIFASISNLIVGLYMFFSILWLARRNYYIGISLNVMLYTIIPIVLFGILDQSLSTASILLIIKIVVVLLWLVIGVKLGIIKKEYVELAKDICSAEIQRCSKILLKLKLR